MEVEESVKNVKIKNFMKGRGAIKIETDIVICDCLFGERHDKKKS